MRYDARIVAGEEAILELRDSVKKVAGVEDCVVFYSLHGNPFLYVRGRNLRSFCRLLDQTLKKYDLPTIKITSVSYTHLTLPTTERV